MQNNILNSQDLININGGGKLTESIILGIIGSCVFIVSIIYGYIHPKGCNK